MSSNQTLTAEPEGSRTRLVTAPVVAVAAALALLMSFVAPFVPTAHAFTDESAQGIDVSRWQHPEPESIDWEKVAENGESFAIIKATDPVDGANPNFENDSEEAHANGLIIGAYHKAHPDLDATEQADDFVEALELQPSDAVTLPPVLDLELNNGLEPDEVIDWAHEFMERVEEQAGRQPMMYTYRSFWRVQMDDTDEFSEYPLWLAAYQDEPPTDDIPGGWDQMTIWQRSETGRVDGLITPVDLNLFNGTEEDLLAFAEGEVDHEELTDIFADLGSVGTSDKSYDQAVSADVINQLIAVLDGLADGGVDNEQFVSIIDVLFSLINSASSGAGSSGGTVDLPETETDEPTETGTTEPTETEATDPTEDESTEPTETGTTEPTETEATEPTEDESTEPTETGTTEPTETESPEPTESETTEPTEDEATEIDVDDLTDEQISEIAEATDLTEDQVIEFLSELRFDNLLSMLRDMVGATEAGDFQFTISDLIDVLNSSLRR